MKLIRLLKETKQHLKPMCRYSRYLTYASVILAASVTVMGFMMQYFIGNEAELLIRDAANEAPKIMLCGFILAFFTDIIVKSGGEQ